MDNSKNDSCPYASANLFSKATVWWLNSVYKKAYKRKFELSDLYSIAENHKSKYLTEKLESNWTKECESARTKKRKPSFSTVFLKTFIWPFLLNGVVVVLSEALRAVGPFFIGELSLYFSNPEQVSSWYPYLCATGLTLSSILFITLDNYSLIEMQTLGWNAKSAVIGLMYKKTFRLNHKALSNTTSGKIVNLTSTDVQRYTMSFMFAHHLWLAPLECSILGYILWRQLGPAGVIGTLVLIFLMLLQSLFGKLFGKLRLRIACKTDERVHATNELIAGMRIVKMYSWEKSFKEMINTLRRKEMRNVFFSSLLQSFNYCTNHSTTQILAFVTFLAFIAMNGSLSLQLVVVSLGYFTVLLLGAGLVYPFAIRTFFETIAVIKRTEDFLLLPELTPTTKQIESERNENKIARIEMIDFTASWTETGRNVVEGVTIKVEKGSLLMVVGPVGAGKSSFLSAILGELPASSGKLKVDGNLAYASQIPWLFSDTVRNNILFGDRYDERKYRQVIEACALEQDIAMFPCGDNTLVGERGITLSGGQKARVSLARLAYRSDTDIAIMDDPLSAVDPSVADHLFEKCICGVLKNQLRVLVTHQVQFLEKADHVLILDEGRVVDQGSYAELSRKGIDFVSLLRVEKDEDEFVEDDHDPNLVAAYRRQISSISAESQNHFDAAGKSEEHKKLSMNDEESVNDRLLKGDKPIKIGEVDGDKAREKSKSISLKSYLDYFNTGVHVFYLVVLLVFVVSTHASMILSEWWLAQWAVTSQSFNDNLKSMNSSPTSSPRFDNITELSSTLSTEIVSAQSFDQYFYLRIYAVLTISYFIMMYIRTAMHYYLCVRSSIQLHDKMLASILKAKIRFFDTNPIGAILNRFSKDMNQVDEKLPVILLDVFFDLGSVLAIIIFVFCTNYFVVIMVIPLSIYLVWIRRYFIATSTEVKRIEGQERSPMFSHLSTTLQGLITIRTFRMQDAFTHIYYHLQDKHGAAWTMYIFGKRWFGYRLDLITTAFIGSCAFFSVILVNVLPDDWPINAGNLGLTLTYSSTLLVWFKWGVRQSAEAESMMTSVERIQEYHKLPEETSEEEDASKPAPPNWPSKGDIHLKNFSFSYYEGGPRVLNDIDLNIKAKEKLGIVGRTGAGKSSIVAALFRMSDQIFGSLKIDHLEASDVALADWRSVLTIIPQDPILFRGTMRKNLDPFFDYSDESLWKALDKVQLKSVVENLPLKLESLLDESGSNLSVGQRQLVCLARAILRDNRILIIDEATANVDTRTDRVIQETIRKEFVDCTVLTIAHRLDTVIDSDRILVLDNGRILECDEAHVLLRNEDGALSEMVKMTGRLGSELRRIAEASYFERRRSGRDSNSHHSDLNESEAIPNIRDHIPNESDHLPNESDHFPNESDHIPKESDHFPNESDHLPNESDHLPNESDNLPNESDHFPNESDHLLNAFQVTSLPVDRVVNA